MEETALDLYAALNEAARRKVTARTQYSMCPVLYGKIRASVFGTAVPKMRKIIISQFSIVGSNGNSHRES